MRRIVTATYRLQLTREFPLAAARALVAYLHELGVSHLYLSPVLAARAGSQHGYDVIDHKRVNPELGSEEDLRALADELHAKGMGIILDVVPNHMAATAANPYWDDTLARGEGSRYADWFDVEWNAPGAGGKIVLPVLGDELDRVLDRGELKLQIREGASRIAHFDQTFPLDPTTLPKELRRGEEGRERLRALLDAQHYRLTFWKHADEINYRRFFDVNDLVALRMETDSVFHETHSLILAWVRDGVVDGLRVDHIDGLRHPSWYLAKLRAQVDATKHGEAPDRFPIIVEKILTGDERLPSAWPVEGTTGYDFLNDIEELFLDADGFKAIEANYRGLRRNPSLDFRAVAREGKRRALNGALQPDVRRVARVAHAWRDGASVDDLAKAIVELIVHLDVYRTYVGEPGLVGDSDRAVLAEAFREAGSAQREAGSGKREAGIDAALKLLEAAFFEDPAPGDRLRTELVLRLQQTSSPASAKGVEDTALYVYVPLASRNEVGGMPDRPLEDVHERVHARNAARARDWPSTMLATNTHDTKRSADLRARLDVLTERPDEWARHHSRWRKLNKPRKRTVRGSPAPDTNLEYLYYQTLLGVWPAPPPQRRVDDLPDRERLSALGARLSAYLLKAAREAKTRTSWTEADTQYERAIEAFVRETLEPDDDAPFLGDVARLTAATAGPGFRTSLARVLLHCTSPGIPDLYQGDELWTFTLVDPDNRRPVDFSLRRRLLQDIGNSAIFRDDLLDDRAKLALLARLLRFRREHGPLFRAGAYVPLSRDAQHELFAFARRLNNESCIAVVRRHSQRRGGQGASRTAISLSTELAGRWHSVLTGRVIDLVCIGDTLDMQASDLIAADQPCELLFKSG